MQSFRVGAESRPEGAATGRPVFGSGIGTYGSISIASGSSGMADMLKEIRKGRLVCGRRFVVYASKYQLPLAL